MKRICVFAIILVFCLFSGCRSIDPFEDSSFELSSADIDAKEKIESSLDTLPNAEIFGEIELIHFTDEVERGDKADLTVKAIPNNEYTIRVTYPSGISKSKSLQPQTADNTGIINWSWQVGVNTKVGEYPVEIACKGETLLIAKLKVI